MNTLIYKINAFRAHKHYKRLGYDTAPCLSCIVEHEPEDTETPWHWVLCDRCDWGNN